MRVVLDQFIKLFATADSKESSSEAARDTNEGNEGVINYPAGTLLHKSQNQWARQRPVCKHTHSLSAQHQSLSLSLSDGDGLGSWPDAHIQMRRARARGLINQQKHANYRSNRLV